MSISYYGNYTPVGDVLTLATCIVFFILMQTAYINRTKSYRTFRYMLIALVSAASCDMVYHMLMNYADTVSHFFIYLFRAAYHLLLFANLYYYVVYILQTLKMDDHSGHLYRMIGRGVWLVLLGYEVFGTVFRFGFYIDETGAVHSGFNIFSLGYIIYVLLIGTALFFKRHSVHRPILVGVTGTAVLSILIIMIQGMHGQSSFTSATFLFPAYAILYLLHSNPYDLVLGAVDSTAFANLIHVARKNGDSLYLMSLYLHDFEDITAKFPKEIQDAIRYFSNHFFKDAVLFRVSGGHLILVCDAKKNPNYKENAQKMYDHFVIEYPKYGFDYKIIFAEISKELGESADYLHLFDYLHSQMDENSFIEVGENELASFKRHQYILEELADIDKKKDMNDPRVLAFCQPVLNTQTGKYDTAEALMRLKLEDIGMVFPDQFIPLAEDHNYIQTLSLIILSKVCVQIHALLEAKYIMSRISVNFSAIDLRDKNFCNNVRNIITKSGIPFDKIAIEITESQNEKDFLMVKEKITELQETGIKFYLDDFGTGYSNFERILELPFDIVKFDRSLTIASGNSPKSETMVNYLAHLFSDTTYSVLFEGVETDEDEHRCQKMCAKYLQGYKYSKPIPIERLTDFFEQDIATA